MPLSNNPTYVSNSVPIGCVTEVIGSGTYVLENLTINRPSTIIQRKNEIGAENGWAMVASIGVTATGVIQVATVAGVPTVGQFFTDTLIGSTPEKFVLTELSQPYAHDTYWKVNATFKVGT